MIRALMQGRRRRAQLIWGDFCRRRIGLDQPHLSILVVLAQLPVAGRVDLSRPDHLGAFDIGGVVYPLVEWLVFPCISNNRELLSRLMFEVFLDLRAFSAKMLGAKPRKHPIAGGPFRSCKL